MGIKVGIVAEGAPGERRVAMVPTALSVLNKTGAELLIETGAGDRAGIPDSEYTAKSVRLASREEVFAAPSAHRRPKLVRRFVAGFSEKACGKVVTWQKLQ